MLLLLLLGLQETELQGLLRQLLLLLLGWSLRSMLRHLLKFQGLRRRQGALGPCRTCRRSGLVLLLNRCALLLTLQRPLLLLLLCAGACWGCACWGDKLLALLYCAGSLLLVTVQYLDDITVCILLWGIILIQSEINRVRRHVCAGAGVSSAGGPAQCCLPCCAAAVRLKTFQIPIEDTGTPPRRDWTPGLCCWTPPDALLLFPMQSSWE